MSILGQQKRLWFVAGSGLSAWGTLALEVRRVHPCKPRVPDAPLLIMKLQSLRICVQRDVWQGVAAVSAQLPMLVAPRNAEVGANARQ